VVAGAASLALTWELTAGYIAADDGGRRPSAAVGSWRNRTAACAWCRTGLGSAPRAGAAGRITPTPVIPFRACNHQAASTHPARTPQKWRPVVVSSAPPVAVVQTGAEEGAWCLHVSGTDSAPQVGGSGRTTRSLIARTTPMQASCVPPRWQLLSPAAHPGTGAHPVPHPPQWCAAVPRYAASSTPVSPHPRPRP
jgi:hypothetical protein